jgi:hypothetical protein
MPFSLFRSLARSPLSLSLPIRPVPVPAAPPSFANSPISCGGCRLWRSGFLNRDVEARLTWREGRSKTARVEERESEIPFAVKDGLEFGVVCPTLFSLGALHPKPQRRLTPKTISSPHLRRSVPISFLFSVSDSVAHFHPLFLSSHLQLHSPFIHSFIRSFILFHSFVLDSHPYIDIIVFNWTLLTTYQPHPSIHVRCLTHLPTLFQQGLRTLESGTEQRTDNNHSIHLLSISTVTSSAPLYTIKRPYNTFGNDCRPIIGILSNVFGQELNCLPPTHLTIIVDPQTHSANS